MHVKYRDKTLTHWIKHKHCNTKAVWVINFRANNYDVGGLYKNDKIPRISDYIKLLNCLFVRDLLINSSILPFPNYINQKIYVNTTSRHAKQNFVILSRQNADLYSIKSIQHQAVTTWNKLQNETNCNVLEELKLKRGHYQ